MYSLFVGLTLLFFFYFREPGSEGRAGENIHLLMRAVINSEQARPSHSPSVRVSLSLCPSDGLPRCLSLPIRPTFCRYLSPCCVALSLPSLGFSSHSQSQTVSLSLSLSLHEFPSNAFFFSCISMPILSGQFMKLLFTPEDDVDPTLRWSFQVIFIDGFKRHNRKEAKSCLWSVDKKKHNCESQPPSDAVWSL